MQEYNSNDEILENLDKEELSRRIARSTEDALRNEFSERRSAWKKGFVEGFSESFSESFEEVIKKRIALPAADPDEKTRHPGYCRGGGTAAR